MGLSQVFTIAHVVIGLSLHIHSFIPLSKEQLSFRSPWLTCSPSGGLPHSSTTAAIRSALEESEGRRQALTQCLKEAQHTIQAQSQRLSCAEGNNILNFTEISGYRFSEQVCTVLYCIVSLLTKSQGLEITKNKIYYIQTKEANGKENKHQ